jgi:N-methylhydantoinase A
VQSISLEVALNFIVGVDVGGTFTDGCAVRLDDSHVFTSKVPTTPDDLMVGLRAALDALAEGAGISRETLLHGTVKFVHGTTQTSNVIFTWSGSKTGLVATRGFGHELLIMRARGRVAGLSLTERRHLRATQKPPQVVEPDHIVEVDERVDARGRVMIELTEAEAEHAVRALLEREVESIAIALLFSPLHPEHELLLERTVRRLAPSVHVTLSHEIAPVIGEYERTSTAAVNAYVAPTLEGYLDQLQGELREQGLRTDPLVVQADGGVARVRQTVPIRTIESGPAAGMVAVRSMARAMARTNVIATDVGGTTFKAGLLIDGDWSFSRETIVNQYSLLMPMVDLISIGAGGGSIAWVDDRRLRVGPRSAGSSPGPACYGWGGTEGTVTDADVVLGFIDPNKFLSGQLLLRKDLAERSMKPIADALFDGHEVAAAAAIRTVVDAQMADLVRKATLERGHDPRRFVLMAYGGAGPLHAASYARGLGIDEIVVPRNATVYSAYGAAASDLRHSVERSVASDMIDAPQRLEDEFCVMEAAGAAWLREQGIGAEAISIARSADMRYQRQLHDIRVPIGQGTMDLAAIRSAFEDRYRGLYGSSAAIPDAPVEILRLVVEATGHTVKPDFPKAPTLKRRHVEADSHREVFWPEVAEWIKTPAFDGAMIGAGDRLAGPAVVDEPGTTVAIPPGATAELDALNNIIIRLHETKS